MEEAKTPPLGWSGEGRSLLDPDLTMMETLPELSHDG